MAATVYYKDIIGQSSLTRGVANRRYDRALRVCEVGSLTNLSGDANTDLRDAINALLAQANVVYHYQLPDLPLREAVVRKWGPNIARVYLYYSRGTWSVPTLPAMTLTSFRTDTYTVEWWRHSHKTLADGTVVSQFGETVVDQFMPSLPSGDFEILAGNSDYTYDQMLADINTRFKPYELTRTALRMFVRTVLPSNPMYPVLGLVGCINSTAVKIGTVTFPKYTVRFNGATVDPIETSGGTAMFSVLYDFTAVPGGFASQRLEFVNPVIVGPPTWHTRTSVSNVPANFANAFPIHA